MATATAMATSPTVTAASAAATVKSSSSRSVRHRRSRRRESVTARRLAGLAAGALALLFAAWWAVKLVAVQEIANLNPFLAARVAPGDPRVKMRLAVVETVLSPGRADA